LLSEALRKEEREKCVGGWPEIRGIFVGTRGRTRPGDAKGGEAEISSAASGGRGECTIGIRAKKKGTTSVARHEVASVARWSRGDEEYTLGRLFAKKRGEGGGIREGPKRSSGRGRKEKGEGRRILRAVARGKSHEEYVFWRRGGN